LHRVAWDCEFPISKLISFPCLALYCTVLRSRWCQSGVRSPRIMGRWFLCSAHSSFPYVPFVTLVRTAAGAPRSRPPPGFRLPHRSRALQPTGRCRCGLAPARHRPRGLASRAPGAPEHRVSRTCCGRAPSSSSASFDGEDGVPKPQPGRIEPPHVFGVSRLPPNSLCTAR
jgi:hypothetical protein